MTNICTDEDKIQDLLNKGVSCIIDRKELEKKLRSGKQLRIKLGIDPTGKHIHLGHSVPILKLRAFQDMGHQIVLIVGDSTGQVGDSSDKNAERPMLTREETRENGKGYFDQFGKILDLDKVELKFNSEWLDKVNFNQVGEIAKHFSVSEMLDRDNFSKRHKAGIRISLQEFLYPLMQGYDSLAIHADVELGGNDQYFNLLAGRTVQDAFGQPKQDIMTFNLIEGTDGQKMSKSLNNFVALGESAHNMFVKLMEIGDDMILKYFEHCTLLPLADIVPYRVRLEDGEHPKSVKLDLAHMIVSMYCGADEANKAKDYFNTVISGGGRPADEFLDTVELAASEMRVVDIVKALAFFSTTGEVRDAISGGAIRFEDEVKKDPNETIALKAGESFVVQAGKKKFKKVVVL